MEKVEEENVNIGKENRGQREKCTELKWGKVIRYKMFKAHLWVYEKSLLAQCAVMLIVEPVIGRLA